jgi:hypothetical protein
MNLDALIEQKSQTDVGKQLVKMLTDIWDDKEFILGCLVDLPGDSQKQKLIDFIKEENETDSDVITLASLDIADGIEI